MRRDWKSLDWRFIGIAALAGAVAGLVWQAAGYPQRQR